MPVKLRLARHGRKKFAFYHIVAADGRAPRDGKFIEKLGIYNPNTNPATIELDFDKSLNWLEKGAQPTETVRAILSYKGVLMKRHLLIGVRKGAFSEEEAEKRFAEWLKEKEGKIQAKEDGLAQVKEDEIKKRLDEESKISEARAAVILKKRSELAEEYEEEATEEAEATDEVSAETEAEVVEAVVEEAAPEAAKEGESKEVEKPEEEPVAEEKKKPAQNAAKTEKEEPKGMDTEMESEGKKADQVKAAGKKAEKQAEDAPKESGETGKEKSE